MANNVVKQTTFLWVHAWPIFFCDVNVFYEYRVLKQPRQRQQQKPHTLAYLTTKNSISVCFAHAFFILVHFEDVLVLSTT